MKSAVRVLEVLEYFDDVRRAASVTEVAHALDYPVSSTSMLLNSLLGLGYLEQNAQRCYVPTPRVTLLGSWVAPQLSQDSHILRMMDELGRITGQTIVLGVASESLVRYIHVVPATRTLRMHVSVGSTRPLAISGTGRLFLSTRSEEKVRQAIFRHNQEAGVAPLSLEDVNRDLQAIRKRGYALSLDLFLPGVGLVAMHLPERIAGHRLALGIGGPGQDIRANATEFIRLMKDAVERYCTPVK
ncbi:IclR family transcriptional regulator [Verticiella sediminum]|uniref:IclR family transcriptional regulator n=1 Tax=Verticiella sediminum TaxID=1247510 RepID=UPI0014793D6A|nr:helix-turn-helix domain-containing protein [Verticiella sediminum]